MTINIRKLNENLVILDCDKGITQEIYDQFSFFMDGYRYTPAYKFGRWDGMIHLFNLRNRTFPVGLIIELIRFLKSNGEEITLDKNLRLIDFGRQPHQFYKAIEDDLQLYPYDYQLEVFLKAIERNRALVLSPTSSGKSLIIYLLVRFLLEHTEGQILISVPSTNLVKQLHGDFSSYEFSGQVSNQCFEMNSGNKENTDSRVVIATWAMLYRRPPNWFTPFNALIVDEAHQVSAPVFARIINNLPHAPFKFGFTGTLKGSKTHQMQCQSWFGSIVNSSTTRELMDRGIVSQLKVKCISLEHSKEERQLVKKYDYHDEIEFLVNHTSRNQFIIDMALEQPKNVLVLFNLIKHGKELFRLAKELETQHQKQIFMITGPIDAEEREQIRHHMEVNDNIVLLATYGTMSFGVNIRNLHTIIFAHPFKARIRNLQSIGRGLRLSESKGFCTLIDIGDDLSLKRSNFTYNHFIQRMRMYEDERFTYTYEKITI